MISNLEKVTPQYRLEFVSTYDRLFSTWLEDLDSYAALSDELRDHYAALHRRFPILHRNGKSYLVSPKTESMRRVDLHTLPKYGPFSSSIFNQP